MKIQFASLLLLLAAPTSHAFLPQQLYVQASPYAVSTTAHDATVTRLPDSAVEIEIDVPGSATQAAYDKVCTELSKNIQIPGFRKGSKIPPQVLEQRMSANGGRNALKVQAINELIGQLVESALKEEALEPIGQPSLKIPAEDLADGYTPGEDLVIPVRCDVWPEIHWDTEKGEKPYVGLTGKYSRKPFNQEKLDKAVSDLRERYATTQPVEDSEYALRMGDACNVNMNGFMATDSGEKGEPLPNAASGDNIEVVLGTGLYIEGLVEGIVGAKVGETRQVVVSFPDVSIDKRHGIRSCYWKHIFLTDDIRSIDYCRNFATNHWLERRPSLMWKSCKLPPELFLKSLMNLQPRSELASQKNPSWRSSRKPLTKRMPRNTLENETKHLVKLLLL